MASKQTTAKTRSKARANSGAVKAKKAPKKTGVTKTAVAKKSAKAVSKKAVAKKSAKAVPKKAVAKKVAVKKAAPKKASVKKVTAEKAAVKKAVAKKVVTKKATLKKPATKKVVVKKAAVKKTAANKPVKPKAVVAETKLKGKKSVTNETHEPTIDVLEENEVVEIQAKPAKAGRPSTFKPYSEKRGEEYMNELQIEHFANILRRWKVELMHEVDRTVLHMKDEAANYPDPNDRATQEEEFSLELRTRDRERKLIRKIDEALGRIERDEYGYCEMCGIEIGIRRLEARPTATLCIDCKTLEEIREKQMAS